MLRTISAKIIPIIIFSLFSCGCAVFRENANLKNKVMQSDKKVLEYEAQIKRLQDSLKEKEALISEKEAKIEELRKKLENFGVF